MNTKTQHNEARDRQSKASDHNAADPFGFGVTNGEAFDAHTIGEWQHNALRISEHCTRLIQQFADRQGTMNPNDVQQLGALFFEASRAALSNPAPLIKLQMDWWQGQMDLMQHSFARIWGGQGATKPDQSAPPDRRFRDDAWSEAIPFDFFRQSYLLTERWLRETAGAIEGLDDKSRASLAFWTGQVSDALSPANFAMTNPAVLREMVESKGESLVRGLENLLHDLEASKGPLTISMCDPNAFTLGKNIATSKGQVVWQNALMQLIQYAPATEQVLQAPLLILPPWINKFYVLDLQPGNSFIKWCVDQGLTVFVVSWVNPDASYRDTGFDDYMRLGVFEALDAIEQACGASKVHALGYCLGGTLLATAMAVMKARGDTRIQSATLLTTMLDFSEPGELGVFTDETQIEALEQKMEARGFLEGNEMAGTFSMMRANDLIWFFVINNYLLGKAPKPFDLLYWNSDSTRMPAAMHSFYLRRMYLENKLAQPAGITIDSVPIDLGSVKVPTFVLATLEDHIAPWQSAWKTTKLLGGKVEFVLSGSGHIAGVINPPSTGKYPHWTNKGANKARFDNAEAWLENAERQSGSWWPSWFSWLCGHSKKLVPARTPGDSKLECIEAAPGSYVRQRFDQKT